MFDWRQEAQHQWNNRATTWSENSKNIWEQGSRKDVIPFFSKFLVKGCKVLDVGCGDGYSTNQLHNQGYEAIGVDLSDKMIEIAKANFSGPSFVQGDISELPFQNEVFDGVMAITVLEWTEHPLVALKELIRVVKEDGLMCIGLLGPTAGPRGKGYQRLYGEKAICNSMMPWELMRLAAEHDLNYQDGYGVYKKAVSEQHTQNLPIELKQALSFMWVSVFRKGGGNE